MPESTSGWYHTVDMEELRARVFGRVQMVLFRDFTRRTARRLGLTGFVRNLEDGSVEVAAQGERAPLEKLLAALRRGSMLSHVERVESEWREPSERFGDFSITYGG